MNKKLAAGDWFFGKILRMGANWQTTLSGVSAALFELLTLLSGASYALGDIALVISPAIKAKVFMVSASAGLILKVWNSLSQKSRNVTGGSTQQTKDGDVAKPGTQNLVDATNEAKPA